MSVIAFISGEKKTEIGIAAGLRWSVLSSGVALMPRKEASAIRQQASLIGAHSYVRYLYDEGTTVLGQYTEPPRMPGGKKPPKILHSLALAFLGSLGHIGVDTRIVNAILLIEPVGFPEKRALIIIEGGQIVRDVIENTTNAIANAQTARELLPSHIVYSQHAEIPNADGVSWEAIASGISAATALTPIPRSPAIAAGIGLLVVAGLGWYAYNHFVVEPEKVRQRRIAAQKADKTPQYMALLRSSLGTVGWDSADLQKQIGDLARFPFYDHGWALQRRQCIAVNQRCSTEWKRTGGQLPSLLALLPGAQYDVVNSSLDIAKLNHDVPMVSGKQDLESLIPIADAAKQLRTALQRLANAEVVVSTGPADRWPTMNYSGVRASVIAQRAPVEIIAPLPTIVAALRELPPNVVMDNYTLVISAGDIGTMFKVSVKGYVYAK